MGFPKPSELKKLFSKFGTIFSDLGWLELIFFVFVSNSYFFWEYGYVPFNGILRFVILIYIVAKLSKIIWGKWNA